MKFDRQLRPATETSWVVSYGGKTIPRWRTAAILKIVISPLTGWGSLRSVSALTCTFGSVYVDNSGKIIFSVCCLVSEEMKLQFVGCVDAIYVFIACTEYLPVSAVTSPQWRRDDVITVTSARGILRHRQHSCRLSAVHTWQITWSASRLFYDSATKRTTNVLGDH